MAGSQKFSSVYLNSLHRKVFRLFLLFGILAVFLYGFTKVMLKPAFTLTGFETRSDGAKRITNCTGVQSCQNPVFSPDNAFVLFTRFKNGYNGGPSELVQVKIDGMNEKIIVPSNDSDNVNVPYGSWIDNKITWASDRGGGAEELYTANPTGSSILQVTHHKGAEGSFIEPVFDPKNTNKILFEFAPASASRPHRIKLLEMDKGSRVVDLTLDPRFDDRLPSWSKDGSKILFQRAHSGGDDWQIYTATISLDTFPILKSLKNISHSTSSDTDNSWAYNDAFVLSSSNFGAVAVANIFAFPANGAGSPVRITNSPNKEDGAPSFSPDGKSIAFESHKTEDENSPSNIWVIPAPNLAVAPTPTPTPVSSGGI